MEKKRIIVAEDDQDLLWLLVEKLTGEGYEVLGLPDGVSIVEGHCVLPDMFILDNEMDFIDGESIARFLRTSAEAKEIPILMLSGSSNSDSAKAAGVNYFFEKPFHISEVIHAIEQSFAIK